MSCLGSPTAELGEDLGSSAAAGADRSIHSAVLHVRGLHPSPVDAADWRYKRPAVLGPHVGSEPPGVAAAPATTSYDHVSEVGSTKELAIRSLGLRAASAVT
jgi:hypothetical protein